MIDKFENFSQFNKALDSVLKFQWKMTSEWALKLFIDRNLRLIIEQTQNITNAQNLQKKLLTLSEKINEKFTNLAFKIMGIAQGIFSQEDNKIDFTSLLPLEVQQKICEELIDRKSTEFKWVCSGLESLRLVSEIESKIAAKTKMAWINNEIISLKALNCNTIGKAIHYIKNNQNLYSVNLSDLRKITNQDLKEIQYCIWIQNIGIASKNITDEGLQFLKRMPLKSVDFTSCEQLTDKAFEYLKDMPLKSVNFSHCPKLTDKAFEYLKDMQLQNVSFAACDQLTDKAFEYLKDMQLQNVCFAGCDQLTDKIFGYLKEMPLKCLFLYGCKKLTSEALENFQQHFISRGLELKIDHYLAVLN